MQSKAKTVAAYLAELPADRRAMVETLRHTILAHLREGFVEAINWGHICYEVPLSLVPKTYNGQPLMYAAIGNQKNFVGLYLHSLYCDADIRARFQPRLSAGNKNLDMGKSCIRLKRIEDIDLDVVGELIGSMKPMEFAELRRG